MDFFVERAVTERDQATVLLMGGAAFFQAVVAAKRLGLFHRLSHHPGSTREELQEALALPPYSLRILLLACQAVGWVVKDAEGGFSCVEWVGQVFADPEDEFPTVLEAFEQILYRPFGHMTEALRAGTNLGLREYPGEGNTLYERLVAAPEKESLFHRWMSSLSEQGLPHELVDALRGHRHVLDVGGGDGTNAILVANAHPGLRVTVLDLPSVCEIASKRIEAAGLSERIDTLACDIRTLPSFPACDAIMFNRIFNIYGPEQNQRFVQRAAEALPEGGKLIVYPSMVLEDDESGPLSGAFLSLYYLCVATGEGRVYAPEEYREWFEKAGFVSLRGSVDEMDDAVFVGVK